MFKMEIMDSSFVNKKTTNCADAIYVYWLTTTINGDVFRMKGRIIKASAYVSD